MNQFRLSVRTLMVATALVAVCFAVFGLFTGGILSTSVLFVALHPTPFRWRTLELGAALAWLLGIVMSASNVATDGFDIACFFVPTGLLLGLSWLFRQASELDKPDLRRQWSALVFTPAAGFLAFLLLGTDMDFRVRLALSEPALRAEVRQLPRGSQKSYRPGRQAGLFKASAVEERDGCVLWSTDAGMTFTTRGLAYVPGGQAPQWAEYRFQHVRGPWWRYTHTRGIATPSSRRSTPIDRPASRSGATYLLGDPANKAY